MLCDDYCSTFIITEKKCVCAVSREPEPSVIIESFIIMAILKSIETSPSYLSSSLEVKIFTTVIAFAIIPLCNGEDVTVDNFSIRTLRRSDLI
jgi:hypothetical protein